MNWIYETLKRITRAFALIGDMVVGEWRRLKAERFVREELPKHDEEVWKFLEAPLPPEAE